LKKIQLNQERCTGCRLCEMVCSLSHEGEMDLGVSRIQIDPSSESYFQPRICLQCQECPPSEVCPNEAFQWDKETGFVKIIMELVAKLHAFRSSKKMERSWSVTFVKENPNAWSFATSRPFGLIR